MKTFMTHAVAATPSQAQVICVRTNPPSLLLNTFQYATTTNHKRDRIAMHSVSLRRDVDSGATAHATGIIPVTEVRPATCIEMHSCSVF